VLSRKQFRFPLVLSYQFINQPHLAKRSDYQSATRRMCNVLSDIPGLKSIYQIGSVSTLGISDIDLVAIFGDGEQVMTDPRSAMSRQDRYFFTHSIYGETVSNFSRANNLSLFHNFKHLRGEVLETGKSEIDPEKINHLKIQVALEFLVKMYINMIVQRTYGVFKLRGTFLHINAIQYDLEFLGTKEGGLFDVTTHLVEVRNNWFARPLSDGELSNLLDLFFDALVKYLTTVFGCKILYLPVRKSYQTAPNIRLQASDELGYSHRGIVLPSLLSKVHSKVINLQHRFNTFAIEVPFTSSGMPGVLDERFDLIEELKRHHARALPHFSILTSSLQIL